MFWGNPSHCQKSSWRYLHKPEEMNGANNIINLAVYENKHGSILNDKVVKSITVFVINIWLTDQVLCLQGVFNVNPDKGLTLMEIADGVDVQEVVEGTGCEFEVSVYQIIKMVNDMVSYLTCVFDLKFEN